MESSVYIWGSITKKELVIKEPKLWNEFEDKRIVQIRAGNRYFLARDEYGRVWQCCPLDDLIPKVIKVLEHHFITYITISKPGQGFIDHCAAVSSEGKLYYWNNAILTHASIPAIPIEIKLEYKIVKIECGDQIWIVLTDSGQVLFSYDIRGTFTLISTLHNVIDISAGCKWCSAVTKEGDLYLWGYNLARDINYLCTLSHDVQEPQLLEKFKGKVKYANLGWMHGTAILRNGQLWNWGDGDAYKLGRVKLAHADTPELCPVIYDLQKKLQCNSNFTD